MQDTDIDAGPMILVYSLNKFIHFWVIIYES